MPRNDQGHSLALPAWPLPCSKVLGPSTFPNKQGKCSEPQRKRNKAKGRASV